MGLLDRNIKARSAFNYFGRKIKLKKNDDVSKHAKLKNFSFHILFVSRLMLQSSLVLYLFHVMVLP